MSKNIIPQNGSLKQATLEARAFVVAFIPEKSQQNTARLWAEKISEARRALTDFSSACHRWQATGQIDPAELVAHIEALDLIGLADFTDELISLATVANCRGEL
jgi:hypothetical protein